MCDVWYIIIFNITDLCLFANMQWSYAARLQLISSVYTAPFTIIPQLSTQESIQLLDQSQIVLVWAWLPSFTKSSATACVNV